MSKPQIVIEDLGGVPADFDDEAHPEDATDAKRTFHSQMRVFSDKSYVFVTKTRAFPPLVADLWRPVATRTRHQWQHVQNKRSSNRGIPQTFVKICFLGVTDMPRTSLDAQSHLDPQLCDEEVRHSGGDRLPPERH